MISCEALSHNFGFRCSTVGDGLLYVESPFTLAFDGQLIGAYVQKLPSGKLRLSDNADIIFTAMSHGVDHSAKRAKKLSEIASCYGATFSESGELITECDEQGFDYALARFIEAADRISMGCIDMLPQPVSAFEGRLYSILKPVFKTSLKRNFSLTGASGHAVGIPLYVTRQTPLCISPVALQSDGKLNWRSIYQASGKMRDLKNAGHDIQRVVVLEPASDAECAQAEAALNEAASVIVFRNSDELITALAA